MDQTDLESDVFAINKSLMRYCKKCGSSTLWKQASGDVEAPTAGAISEPRETTGTGAGSSSAGMSGRTLNSAGAKASQVAVASTVESTGPATTPPARQENRRKHVRTKVNFKACVRYQNFADDIVTCEDMSRGGLRFKSRQRYVERAKIEIAAPYSAGTPPIFVTAQIVFVQELRAERMFRYGVAYLHSLDRR